ITAFVESQALCCTHFDAFRFFTTAASPRNRFQLDRFSNNEYEQPGCIHATMDLYKWSFQLMPYLSSKLLADAFELAVTAREIDMRASPYDLRALGFPPIPIETTQGREEYTMYQQALYEKAQPIRQSLLVAYYQMEQEVSKFISAA
ncbi:MAG TPA: 3-methyladenine DNA glycosylase, partial [Gemmatales bacterium]|nr:3-methyladenine DNA glycosylase [Gemmatales bacterium]